MKSAIANYPMMSNVETISCQPVRQKLPAQSRERDRAQAAAYLIKGAVILSSVTMMFCLINYGRIFQNYLQW